MRAGSAKSRWCVLTGRPCSGISTTLNALAGQGFRVVEEAARGIIDQKIALGMSVREIRGDDVTFQTEVLRQKRALEDLLPRDGLFILDRALPDSVPYHAAAGLDPSEVLKICERDLYHKVFFLEPLPYVADYARTESAMALDRIGKGLFAVYQNLGYEVISVPARPVQERARCITHHIESDRG